MAELTEQQKIEARQKYVEAFNNTMVEIWKEQIVLLGAIRTGHLFESPIGIRADADGRFTTIMLAQEFAEYGLWVNYGTGREVYRGNHGDIGRAKERVAKPWFSKKFYSSYFNIRDFMADSLGQEFCAAMADALDYDKMRRNSNYYRTHAK